MSTIEIPESLLRAQHLAAEQPDDLRRFVAIMAGMGGTGDEPTVAHYLLEHGRMFDWQPRPAEVPKMTDKECYSNAFEVAQVRGLTYCEGYAHCGLIPVMHAWCITDEGTVVDPTWHEREGVTPEYFGLAFDLSRVTSHIIRQEYYGVLPNWMQPAADLTDLLNAR